MAAMLKILLVQVESEAARLRVEVARLQGSLTKAKGKAPLIEHHAAEATVEAIEAFRKGEEFCQEFL